ncbi:Abi family protein [Tetragenococcus koreensis]|uniref:Abi family protein n=1 Tax=Tetragenococcus koreensis TaxID=290335 RepID=A0AAN4UA23_9ENTE|nr:Abi family protein [Tetragenococcus koreensis]MCF1619709.1 Abi family protein [Tetragenococcus koreensis]MCF1657178.1 Abi family protein [Tetragenococcus koreensis]MDN6290368.1 Abi family protein [Tetragenococcus koreensis]MDN6670455.1 Abi family protein [Tetragenococcus koreensis]GEQ48179.1 hypothetical protein TK11N_00310 [Tetragenococcus koreensis]
MVTKLVIKLSLIFLSWSYSDKVIIWRRNFEKYYNESPIWVVLDLASIGKLRFFVNYLVDKYPTNNYLKLINNNIRYVSDIRNSCAHNKPILLNLQKTSRIYKPVFTNAQRMGLKKEEIKNLKVAKIFSVFELHRIMCSQGMNYHRYQEFSIYLDRVEQTIALHEQNNDIKRFFSSLRKILDEFKSE